jgi:hypothetical protein
MIKLDTWESLDGTQTPIVEMDTRHIINAIQVIERNDPRYGVKHGAALSSLLKEVERRAYHRQKWGNGPHDEEAHRFVESRKPATRPARWSVGFDPAGAQGYAGVAAFERGQLVAYAYRRLDKVEKTIRDNEADLTVRTEQLWKALNDDIERIDDLEARITAIETPPAKTKCTSAKAKRAARARK